MARTTKHSQKRASKSKPWSETLHQLGHQHVNGHLAGQKKPQVPVRWKRSVSQLFCRYRNAPWKALDRHSFLSFTKMTARSFEKCLHFHTPAVLALREASQAYLLELFEDWNTCAIHAKRSTIRSSDIHLTRCLRGGTI